QPGVTCFELVDSPSVPTWLRYSTAQAIFCSSPPSLSIFRSRSLASLPLQGRLILEQAAAVPPSLRPFGQELQPRSNGTSEIWQRAPQGETSTASYPFPRRHRPGCTA